jgi:hypothetical protein
MGRLEAAVRVASVPLYSLATSGRPLPPKRLSPCSLGCTHRFVSTYGRRASSNEALKSYRDSLAIRERLAASDRSNTRWQDGLRDSIGRIDNFILARNFASTLEASDLAISLAPDTIWLRVDRAHALMFLGRVDDARALYLRYRREKDVQDGKPWETVVLEDFSELRKAGLTHPLMDEIKERQRGSELGEAA